MIEPAERQAYRALSANLLARARAVPPVRRVGAAACSGLAAAFVS
jgi:hypothetical protein